MLLTIEEGRRLLVASAGKLLAMIECPDTARLAEALWGRDPLGDGSMADQALAAAHRRLLAHLDALGYGGDAADQLGGICEAAGLAEGRRDYDFVAAVLGEAGFDDDDEESFWSWLLAA